MRHRAIAAVTAAIALAGCGTTAGQHHAVGSRSGLDVSKLGFDPTAWTTNFSKHSVPLSEFQSGGPQRDGIPPIDHPKPAAQSGGDRFLTRRDPVIAVQIGGQARAYPLQILVWHEIVNDTVAGTPIAVTYCPLCNSGLVFDRRVGGRLLSFGTTGNLRDSDLVMWDRQTQSWWQQLTGNAVVGSFTGTQLRALDAQILSWSDFKARYPGGDVLSRDTGFDRPYGDNPYTGYETPNDRPFLYGGRLDPRLPPKERVAEVSVGSDTVVVPFSALARKPTIEATVGGTPAVIFFKHGVLSALDASHVRDSRDIGTVAAFDRRADGRQLSFTPRGAGYVDGQTRSSWDITGRAVAGKLAGRQLQSLHSDQEFWFSVAALLPHARLVQ
jgi:hypothetical protein